MADRPLVRTWLPAAAIATGLAGAAAAVYQFTGRFWGDLGAYRAGAAAAATGDGNLYQASHLTPDGIALGFTYPPFAALLMQPLAVMSMPVAVATWTVASVVALVAVIGLVLRQVGTPDRHRPAATIGALVAALPVFAVAGHLQVGQVGLILMWLVLADLVGGRHRRWHGLGVGIAAGIKLTPLIFIGLLVLTGRWRAAATALGGLTATVAIGFAWRPADSTWFFSGGLLDTDRVTGDPRTVLNQSLSGAVTRVMDDPAPGLVWWVLAAVVAVAGMAVAVGHHRRGDVLVAVLVCAATGLLISPVSWHHHWVWWVPALLLLAGHAWRHRHRGATATAAAVWVVLVASTSWVLAAPGGWDLHFTGPGLVYSNLYVLLGAVAIGLAGWRLRRPTGPPAPATVDTLSGSQP
ncbi:glycosyltransferase 87 family protein [Solwaraspora sp. WMMD791]|uniref:glycosyltransferase 87 family protein n=1 Tax=Solwaraspora sp. WMMD791 TaxID=3016086 RepID=UPI00249A8F87|nr:glycosyltransferase 87 family protein [Solwaraspora sp. WMMD791]WFE30493.1 glycosyltransferase 87 family protein [Solwaraspora sp. WMMD791]